MALNHSKEAARTISNPMQIAVSCFRSIQAETLPLIMFGGRLILLEKVNVRQQNSF